MGTFGKIVFETSSEKVLTFDGFERQTKARFASHTVIGQKPVLEHLGTDLDQISMNILFDAFLGVNPLEQINALREMISYGEEQNLVINDEKIGKFVIESMNENWKAVDNKGRLLAAQVSITLKEYVDNAV
ncbi:MAG: phage tail protein [Desulfobacteraceae bacterium]|nr:phage tail protein [Desulfobacteraceae bacterium]